MRINPINTSMNISFMKITGGGWCSYSRISSTYGKIRTEPIGKDQFTGLRIILKKVKNANKSD